MDRESEKSKDCDAWREENRAVNWITWEDANNKLDGKAKYTSTADVYI